MVFFFFHLLFTFSIISLLKSKARSLSTSVNDPIMTENISDLMNLMGRNSIRRRIHKIFYCPRLEIVVYLLFFLIFQRSNDLRTQCLMKSRESLPKYRTNISRLTGHNKILYAAMEFESIEKNVKNCASRCNRI